MARTYLSAEERREQILDCAQDLFFEKGYDATTVQDLMLAAGVSKGGFYHHFAAKEDVLEALSLRLAAASVPMIEEVMQRPGLTAFERLNQSLKQLRQFKREQAEGIVTAFAALFRPENVVFYERINRANSAVVLPLLAEIIEAGREDGSFNVPDARLAAEAVLGFGSMTRDVVARAIAARGLADRAGANAELERGLAWQGIVIDRILGIPDGSVDFVEPGFVDALLPPDR